MSLPDALNGLVAEAITADLSDSGQRIAIADALRGHALALQQRPALRAWLALIARWLEATGSQVSPELLSEALLAAATWAEGGDPDALGLLPSVDHVMAACAVAADRRKPWLERLSEEAQQQASVTTSPDPAAASPAIGASSVLAGKETPADQVHEPTTTPVESDSLGRDADSPMPIPSSSERAVDLGIDPAPGELGEMDSPLLPLGNSDLDANAEQSLMEDSDGVSLGMIADTPLAGDLLDGVADLDAPELLSLGDSDALDSAEPTLGDDSDQALIALLTDGAAPQTGGGPIYIAPEESQMLLEALHGELLPALIDFSMSPAPRVPTPAMQFNLQSQGNALAVLGLPTHAELLNAASSAIDQDRIDDDTLALLGDWLVQLGELLAASEGASERATEAGTALAAALGVSLLLQDECDRVRIEIDPSYSERPRRTIGEGDLDLRPADDVIPSVLRGMLQELPQNAESLARAVERMRAGERGDVLADARRFAHTLKGDANTVGIRGLANLTHALEDILLVLVKQDVVPSSVMRILGEAADTVAAMADAVLGRGPAPDAVSILGEVYRIADALERDEPIDDSQAPTAAAPPVAPLQAAVPSVAVPSAAPSTPEPERDDEQVSIPRRVLDRLLEQSAESVALSNQLKDALGHLERAENDLRLELTNLRVVSQALDEQITLRANAIDAQRQRHLEVDALELDQYNELDMLNRRVAEVQADLIARSTDLGRAREQIETLARRKQLSDDDIQASVRRARLVPLTELTPRFQRAARQAARQLDKEIEFVVQGDQIAIDKTVLEGMIEPVMHLIRNAIDHGIEDGMTRLGVGKSEIGKVQLDYSTQGQTLQLSLSDDGGGIQHERVRERALQLGIAGAAEADAATLRRLLLQPGFSTRTEVTQMSGRGVGLDIVAARVQRLGGSLTIESKEGEGTRFILSLPLSLGNLQVAIVRTGAQRYALAADAIERLLALSAGEQRDEGDQREVLIDGSWQAAIDISASLGGSATSDRPVAAVLRGDVRNVVLLPPIENLATVVLKPLGDYLPPIRGIRGATLLGDGSVAPVMDLRELVGAETIASMAFEEFAEDEAPLVVVADDSLTIRRSLGELLEDTGYRVELARDGLEALIAIENKRPSALLVDLEMPRMNGLELTQYLRRTEDFAELPIIMITSRSSEKHRDLASDAGVSAMLGKPYSDEDVLSLLAKVTAGAA